MLAEGDLEFILLNLDSVASSNNNTEFEIADIVAGNQ